MIAKLSISLICYLISNPCAAQGTGLFYNKVTLLANGAKLCTLNSMFNNGFEMRRHMCSPHLPEQDCYFCKLDESQRTFLFISRLLIFSAKDFDKKTLQDIFKVKFHKIKKSSMEYLVTKPSQVGLFRLVEMRCVTRNSIKTMVIAIDEKRLSLTEEDIVKVFGDKFERNTGSAEHSNDTTVHLIYRGEHCTSTFSFPQTGAKLLTGFEVSKY